MADYYSILKRTISSLPENNGAARRSVYSRARNAIVNQLKAYEPPLSPSEITAEQLRLEEAIRKVEAEAARESLGLGQAAAKAPAPSTAAPVLTRQEPPAPQPAAPRVEAEPSLQQAAPSVQPPVQVPVQSPVQSSVQAPVAPASPLKSAVDQASQLGEASHKAVQSTKDAMSASAPSVSQPRQEPVFGSSKPEPQPEDDYGYGDDDASADDLSASPEAVVSAPQKSKSDGQRRGKRKPASGAPRKKSGSSGFPILPLALVAVLVLVIAGAVVFLSSGDDSAPEVAVNTPASDPTPPPDTQPETPATGTAEAPAATPENGKIEDRLLDDSGEPAAAPDARSVTTTLITPQETGVSSQPSSPSTDAPLETPAIVNENSGIASVTPQSDSGAVTAGTQRSILYEEGDEANGAGTASQGEVTWALNEETDLEGKKHNVLSADIQIPERNVSVSLKIKPNDDPSLPASHLVEIKFDFPEDFAAGEIVSVPGLVMKPTEEARGDGLIGASVKVSPGYFWIALSSLSSERERNMGLLRERGWIDIPMLFENGKRGILTLEKGGAGTAAVEQAVTSWQAG
ncbi:hypothetical protein [Roseibium suaedae]|uniref:CheA signal transduction histidine kinase n=1 Tax=Roseibium suaedae TaxID=735517 RepID=A0A1M7ILR4_9HYPH|nr:hypothetical protein [Roseibium suaedae]SHM41641.1 hypothetical protein SAMN05444272_2573 [Roseibium suaedae]